LPGVCLEPRARGAFGVWTSGISPESSRDGYDREMAHGHDVDRFDRWAPTYDRHRLQRLVFEPMQQTLLDVATAQIANPKAILDVGCGTGRLLRSAHDRFPNAALEGVDAAAGMVREAEALTPPHSGIHYRQATAESLPFPDRTFDLVFSTMTFHHWSDQEKGIAEIQRVLAPGGQWLLADFMPSGFMRLVRRIFRMRQFPVRGEIDARLSNAGLVVKAERKVPRLRGQVTVLAIGLP
jgi:ubiquinone/menaquinone biosynthesis C-methylase UbiE